MAAPKGHKRYGGRAKGTPNKFTHEVRLAIAGAVAAAFDDLGGREWLVKVAKRDPKVFLAAVTRLLPQHVEANVAVSHEEALRALDDDGGAAQS